MTEVLPTPGAPMTAMLSVSTIPGARAQHHGQRQQAQARCSGRAAGNQTGRTRLNQWPLNQLQCALVKRRSKHQFTPGKGGQETSAQFGGGGGEGGGVRNRAQPWSCRWKRFLRLCDPTRVEKLLLFKGHPRAASSPEGKRKSPPLPLTHGHNHIQAILWPCAGAAEPSVSSLIIFSVPLSHSSRCTTATTAALLHHSEEGRTLGSLVNKLPTCSKISRKPIIFFILNERTAESGNEKRSSQPTGVRSLWRYVEARKDHRASAAEGRRAAEDCSLSLAPPSSSFALSTALLIQWGGFVRRAPTRCAQGAWLRFSSASEVQSTSAPSAAGEGPRAGPGISPINHHGTTTDPFRSRTHFILICNESIFGAFDNNIRCFIEAP